MYHTSVSGWHVAWLLDDTSNGVSAESIAAKEVSQHGQDVADNSWGTVDAISSREEWLMQSQQIHSEPRTLLSPERFQLLLCSTCCHSLFLDL